MSTLCPFAITTEMNEISAGCFICFPFIVFKVTSAVLQPLRLRRCGYDGLFPGVGHSDMCVSSYFTGQKDSSEKNYSTASAKPRDASSVIMNWKITRTSQGEGLWSQGRVYLLNEQRRVHASSVTSSSDGWHISLALASSPPWTQNHSMWN